MRNRLHFGTGFIVLSICAFTYGAVYPGNGATGFGGAVGTGNLTITMTAAQMAQIGLTAGSGQTFSFDGSYISTSAYRSNETVGPSVTTPGDGAGNAGFNNPQTFTQGLTYTLVTVPEPASLALLVLGGLASVCRRRR